MENFHITLTDDYVMEDQEPGSDGTYLKGIYNDDVYFDVRLHRYKENSWNASYTAIQFANNFTYPEGTTIEQYITEEDGLLYMIRRYDSPTENRSRKALDVFYKAANGFWFLHISATPDYFDAHLDELKAFARTVTFD